MPPTAPVINTPRNIYRFILPEHFDCLLAAAGAAAGAAVVHVSLFCLVLVSGPTLGVENKDGSDKFVGGASHSVFCIFFYMKSVLS